MTSLADSLRFQKCRPFDSRLLPFCETPTQELIYKTYGQSGSIVNEAARRLKMDPSQVSKSVRTIQHKGRAVVGFLETNDVGEVVTQDLKILIFDIETAPSEAYVFDFYNQNISHDQIKRYGHVMSFAARWFGTEEIIYHECRTGDDKKLIQKLIDLFDQADVLVAHNGKAFDVKTVRGRALKHETKVPNAYKVVDTFLIAKNEFKLPRNSLEFIAEYLGCTPKLKHGKFPGISLWKECLAQNPEAWDQLREYNIGDLRTLEEVYLKLRKWATTHPNLGNLLDEVRNMCPKCGSGELAPINAIKTNTQVYPGYRCKNCGGLCRGRYTIATKEKRRSILVNAA